MKRICSWAWPLVIAGTVVPAFITTAGAVDPADPPEGRFYDDWAEIYLAGRKIGYAHSTLTRQANLIRTNSVMKMELGRGRQPISIGMQQGTTETLAGIPVEFVSSMDMATIRMETRGIVAEGRMSITTSQYGMEQVHTLDFPTGALMPWGFYRETLRRGFEPGTKYQVQVYAPELRLDGAVTATTEIGGRESFTHRNKSISGQKVIVAMETPVGTMETISWVDQEGRPLKTKVSAPGLGDLEVITTDQATALGDFLPPELFLKTVIRIDRKIDAKTARRIKYRISAKDEKVDLRQLPSTEMQTVGIRTANAVELTVTRQAHEPAKSGRSNGSEPDLSEYVDANLMINTDDPKLIALAEQAARGETEPFALADKLRRFVTDYVTSKNLNIGFATASEVCRTREGDCSEHGVLLAALGRLNGLPSRVAVGLAYVPHMGGYDHVFGYHLWTQFHIDGRWVDFDAALRESDCSPTRIAFATSSLKNAGLADLSIPLLSKIGAIEIEVLEIDDGFKP